jgi:hypothetical protein
MRYAKWKLFWQNDEGTSPNDLAREQGYYLEGGFFAAPGGPREWIYGYVADDLEISLFSAWQMIEVTQDEIIAAARQRNVAAYFDQNEKIATPPILIE